MKSIEMFEKHKEIIKADCLRYEKIIRNNFSESGLDKIKYSGKNLSFYYSPLFFSRDSLLELNRISSAFCALLQKIYLLFQTGELDRFLPFSKNIKELIKLPNGYDEFFPILRLDYFYDFETERFFFVRN